MRNFPLKTKFSILLVTFVAGLGGYCAFTDSALRSTRIGAGPYQEITAMKDVVKDMAQKGGTLFDDEVIKAFVICHRNGTLFGSASNPTE